MPESPAVIECVGLQKTFPGVDAVRGLDLEVHSGEVVGLLGPNGAGKTTTLRMLAAILAPTSGRASIGGFDTQKQPLEAKSRLGFLTGNTSLYARLSPRELLDFFGRLHGQDRATRHARTNAIIAQLRIGPFADRACGKLSSGERQRVSIARALVHDPVALILDEPTASLDVISASFLLESIREARTQGKAVLFSTHILTEAELLCDRIHIIHRGRIIADGSVAELCAEAEADTLTSAFLALIAGADEEEAA